MITDERKLARIFGYLDDLRASAVTNMFGAAPYIADAFNMDKREAREILRLWMELPLDQPTAERAKAALAKAHGDRP